MDGTTHNGLGKLLPRSLTAKRRRNKTSSLAETVSSTEDAASLRARSIASIASQDDASTNEPPPQDITSDLNEKNRIDSTYDSDPEDL